ncbi:MAG: hypothetical protein ACXAEU_17905 [Candidatus Hodarchaeales archaeon]|jgi:hypothetical protein
MPSCPDCGGEMKWHPPFYVCGICGVSYRKHELARAKEKLKWKSKKYQREEEEPDEKEKRKKSYISWYSRTSDD